MRYVLAYDVVKNSRRAKLFKRLRGLLTPVQKSVFEGDLGDGALAELDALVHDVLDLQTDHVRVYRLCAACAREVRLHGASVRLPNPDDPMEF